MENKRWLVTLRDDPNANGVIVEADTAFVAWRASHLGDHFGAVLCTPQDPKPKKKARKKRAKKAKKK